jgi:hypothetical protein
MEQWLDRCNARQKLNQTKSYVYMLHYGLVLNVTGLPPHRTAASILFLLFKMENIIIENPYHHPISLSDELPTSQR